MDKSILDSIVSTILPQEIYLHFELVSITQNEEDVEIRLDEYAELVPPEMSAITNIVLDGFCNPLSLLHFSINGKPLYLKLFRRRWKESGSNKHFSNHYSFHPEGVKTTHEFASFLKDEVGYTADEYVRHLIGT